MTTESRCPQTLPRAESPLVEFDDDGTLTLTLLIALGIGRLTGAAI